MHITHISRFNVLLKICKAVKVWRIYFGISAFNMNSFILFNINIRTHLSVGQICNVKISVCVSNADFPLGFFFISQYNYVHKISTASLTFVGMLKHLMRT